MISRPFVLEDTGRVLELWKLHNSHDVYLPASIACRFRTVYLDDNGQIIGFSCINMLPELILVHDKSLTPFTKYEMFNEVLEVNRFNAKQANWPQLYAFLDGDSWIRHLVKAGFKLFEKGIYYLELRSK